MGTTNIEAKPNDQRIEMTREFDAPRDLVYRALVEPDLLAEWMGPERLTMEIDVYEPRDGGRWRFVHRDDEGNAFGFRGVFHGDPSPDKTIRTFEWEGLPGHVSLETATLEEHDGRTHLRMVSVFETVEDRDGMIANGMETGVNEGFDKLDRLLERIGAPA
jgi:uncharacterized protein YndB with AHSA1/START domain